MLKKYTIICILALLVFSCTSSSRQKVIQDKNAFEFYHKSVADYEAGNFNDALAKIDQAIKINPNFAQFHRQKGDILHQQQKISESLDSYLMAVNKRTNFPEAIIKIAFVYQNDLNDFEKAAEYFRRAYKLDINYSQYLLNAAHCYLEMKKIAEAELVLDEFRQNSIINGIILPYEFYLQKGRLNILTENYKTALNNIKQALRFNPDDLILIRMKIKCLFELNNIDEGIVLVSKLLSSGEAVGDMYYYRGIYFYKKQNINDSEKQFLRAIENGTTEKKVYKYLGELKADTEPVKALEYYLKYKSIIKETTEKKEISKRISELEEKIRSGRK